MPLSKMREYWAAWKRILVLARRPDEEEYSLLMKLNFLGFTLVGSIAYIIHLVYVLLTA